MGIEYSNQSIVLHDYFESAEGWGGRLCLILACEFLTDMGYGFKVQNHPYFTNSAFDRKEKIEIGVTRSVSKSLNCELMLDN